MLAKLLLGRGSILYLLLLVPLLRIEQVRLLEERLLPNPGLSGLMVDYQRHSGHSLWIQLFTYSIGPLLPNSIG